MSKILYPILSLLLILAIGCYRNILTTDGNTRTHERWESVSTIFLKATDIKSLSLYKKSYEIGKEYTAFVGEKLFSYKEYTGKGDIYAIPEEDISLDIMNGGTLYKKQYKKGMPYRIFYMINFQNESLYIIDSGETIDPYEWEAMVDSNGHFCNEWVYNNYWKMIYSDGRSHTEATNSIFKFDVDRLLKHELIFSGKNNTSMEFAYREFLDDMARPPFYQNLTYKPDAKQIRFKGFLIQLHDISNDKVTYTIIEDGLG